MTKTNTLLLELQAAEGCSYLSDLHTGGCIVNEQIRIKILAIPLERYSLQEWNEAASYITKTQCHYHSVEAAREAISSGMG